MEYNELPFRAAYEPDTRKRLSLVSCIALSCSSSIINRTLKPFNPLLGETYELEIEGMRYISEQVSHHPPISSGHCETDTWIFYASVEVKTSFKGTYLQAKPYGALHVILKNTGDHFVWTKPYVNIHNIIVGTIYIDAFGTFEV